MPTRMEHLDSAEILDLPRVLLEGGDEAGWEGLDGKPNADFRSRQLVWKRSRA